MSRYKDECPDCGGVKDVEARTCRWCSYPAFDSEGVPQDWLVAFTGFFFADGCITIIVRGGKHFSPRAAIRQRADNARLLDDIAVRLGGDLAERRGKVNPHVEWVATGSRYIAGLCKLLLQCPLLAKKKQEAKMVLDFIEWRRTMPAIWTDGGRREALRRVQELKDFRAF